MNRHSGRMFIFVETKRTASYDTANIEEISCRDSDFLRIEDKRLSVYRQDGVCVPHDAA